VKYSGILQRRILGFQTWSLRCKEEKTDVFSISFSPLRVGRTKRYSSSMKPDSAADPLSIPAARGFSTLRTPSAAGAYPCSYNLQRSPVRDGARKFPRSVQPCRRRDEKQSGTDSGEAHLRGLETKAIIRLCIHSKSQLITRPRRRQLKFSPKVRTVSAQSP